MFNWKKGRQLTTDKISSRLALNGENHSTSQKEKQLPAQGLPLYPLSHEQLKEPLVFVQIE